MVSTTSLGAVAAPRRNYNTLFERQSSNPIDGMDTTLFTTMIESLYLECGLTLPQSLVVIQLAIRLGQVPI